MSDLADPLMDVDVAAAPQITQASGITAQSEVKKRKWSADGVGEMLQKRLHTLVTTDTPTKLTLKCSRWASAQDIKAFHWQLTLTDMEESSQLKYAEIVRRASRAGESKKRKP
jgi:hypothetical protein